MATKTGPLALAILALTLALSCGCGTPKRTDPTETEQPLYQGLRSAEDLFAFVPFDLTSDKEFLSAYDLPPSTNADYLAALQILRSNGPEALSAEQLDLLVVVGWYGYVMQADSTRERMLELDPSSTPVSDIEVNTSYRFQQIDASPAVLPIAMRWKEQLQSGHGDGYLLDSDERLDLYDVTEPGTADEQVQLTRWERRGEDWACQRGSAAAEYWYWFTARQFPAVEFARGKPTGLDVVQGRQAYKLEAEFAADYSPSIHWFGQPMFYWLDAETLMPLQEEYRLDNGDTRLLTLEQVNGNVDLTPPNVGACTEKSFDP